MFINTNKLMVTFATAAAILWLVCSILVALLPDTMTTMTGHMIHMDLANNGLSMSLTGFIVGLIGWVIMAGSFALLLGSIYNATATRKSDKSD